jgi:hypothetical protein
MKKYSAIAAQEYGIGTGVNGYGKRAIIRGAYTIETVSGRRVRAFTDREGGLTAAQKWADELNDRGL